MEPTGISSPWEARSWTRRFFSPSPASPSQTRVGAYCNVCLQYLSEATGHYRCGDCAHFDLCRPCHGKGLHDPTHLMSWEPLHPSHVHALLRDAGRRSLAHLLHSCFVYFAARPLLGLYSPPAGGGDPHLVQYVWRTYQQTHLKAIAFALGMRHVASPPPSLTKTVLTEARRERRNSWGFATKENELKKPLECLDGVLVGVCGRNNEEWVVADLGSALSGMVTVPIPTTFTSEQKQTLLENSGVQCVLVGTRTQSVQTCGCAHCVPRGDTGTYELLEQFLRLVEANADSPSDGEGSGGSICVRQILALESPCVEARQRAQAAGVLLSTFEEVMVRGTVQCDLLGINEDTIVPRHPDCWTLLKNLLPRGESPLYSIMYTSGSTSAPKGVIVTKDSWVEQILGALQDEHPHVSFIFGALSHNLDRRSLAQTLGAGGRVALYQGVTQDVLPHVQHISPSTFVALPRFWNQLHAAYQADLATAYAALAEDATDADRHTAREAVLINYSQSLGNRIRQVITTGAAVSPEVYSFLQECFVEASVSNGYSATEVGRITLNEKVLTRRHIQVRLEDVPDMGFLHTDTPHPRGEICVRKAHMISEYYNNPEATACAFTEDGFFRTGDIGAQVGKDQYILIARRENLFKLASGHVIAPEIVEGAYQGSAFVEQIFVYGDASKSFLLAVVVPQAEQLQKWWQETTQEHASVEEICQTEAAEVFLLSQLYQAGLRNGLAPHQFVRGILLEARLFTLENKRLMGSFKIHRHALREDYQERLENLSMILENTDEQIFYDSVCQVAEDALIGIVRELLDLPEDEVLNGASCLRHIGLDSLNALKLSHLIQTALGWPLAPSDLLRTDCTVHALSQSIAMRAPLPQTIDWAHESHLPEAIVPCPWVEPCEEVGESEDATPPLPTCYLVTGATGFLGSTLVATFLRGSRSCRVICLVRQEEDQVHARWKQAWGLDCYPRYWDPERVQLLRGDLTLPHLGVTEEEWASLAQSVNVIVHAGAQRNVLLPYSALRDTNVGGMVELLRLCGEGRPKAFHFVSSDSILQELPPDEKEEPMGPRLHPQLDEMNGHAQSQWVAERLLVQAHQRGLRCSISRPARMAPHSTSAFWNPNDLLMRMLRGTILMKAYPMAPHVTWNMPSVDFIAVCVSLIVESMGHGENILRAYNISQPGEGVELSQLMTWVSQAGYVVTERSYEGWKLLLEGVSDSHPLAPLVGFFQHTDRFPHVPGPTCSRMKALIATSAHPISCPLFDSERLGALLTRMQAEGHLPPPPAPASSRQSISSSVDSEDILSVFID